MKESRCLCCGSITTSNAPDADVLCSNCDGTIYREILSEEYLHGHNSFSNLHLKPQNGLKIK